MHETTGRGTRRRWSGAALVLVALLAAPALRADVEELFSRHVQVFQPQGSFARQLIRSAAPAGSGWRLVEDPESGCRLRVPAAARVDASRAGSRILHVVLSDDPAPPRPVLRLDVFTPEAGEPAEVDAEYVSEFVEQYPARAFGGKFAVSDSGLVVTRKQKLRFAMVGGTYSQGAAPAYRLQCALPGKDRHFFLTFDCAESQRERYQEVVSQILLGFELPARKGR